MKIELDELQQQARKRIILPLDGLKKFDDVEKRVEDLSPVVGIFKVGKETFTRFGPQTIEMINSHGSEVFLDLKYHDIGNTVRGASDAASMPGVAMFNVHASNGYKGMLYAKEAVEKSKYNPKLIGVTILTSMDEASYIHTNMHMLRTLAINSGDKFLRDLEYDLNQFDFLSFFELEKNVDDKTAYNVEINMYNSLKNKFNSLKQKYPILKDLINKGVEHYAHLSERAGLDGVVCSAADLKAIRNGLPFDFNYVNPGIQHPSKQSTNEQKRVLTPYNAIQEGATYLVIGRAITEPITDEQKRNNYKVTKEMQQQAGLDVINDMVPALK